MPPSVKRPTKKRLVLTEKENSKIYKKGISPAKNKSVVLKTVDGNKESSSSSDSDSELDEVFVNLRRKGIGVEKSFNSSPKSVKNEVPDFPKKTTGQTPKKYTIRMVKKTPVKEGRKEEERTPILRISLVRLNLESTPKKEEEKATTPKRSLRLLKRAHSEELEDRDVTPVKKSRMSLLTSTPRTPRNRKLRIESPRTPQSQKISMKVSTPQTPIEKARASLHVCAVPENLSCREKEFKNIYQFVENKLTEGTGGCMYISGVPGTGKTATVTQVIRRLQEDTEGIPKFQYVELNGMRLTDPRQAYVVIYKSIFANNDRISSEVAQKKLLQWFNKPNSNKKPTVILLDELDLMCTRKQDVVFNLLDWPSHPNSKLIVLTIANTMDMPERKLKGRVTSRLGLTRVTFLPYTYKQLEEIITNRLKDCCGEEAFATDAIRLATRKVAAVSGDARRALDICRRATELVADLTQSVTIKHIETAIKEMTNTNIIQCLRGCSDVEKLFLRAVKDCAVRSGLDEVAIKSVLEHLFQLCGLEGLPRPTVSAAMNMCRKLTATRFIFSSNLKAGLMQRITLNVSQDDIHYAFIVNDV